MHRLSPSFRFRGFFSTLVEKRFNRVVIFSTAAVLFAEILQIVLGLLLGILGCSLGVGVWIQQMNRFMQALRFIAGALTAGNVGAREHARHAGTQAIEVESQ